MTDEETLVKHVVGLYFNYACRALLGGGKGMYVMNQLYQQSPECYRLVYEAARLELMNKHPKLAEKVDERYRQLQLIVGDLEKERSN